MNQPKVSVIVAVFNAEKTLTRLADSLKAQTMPDFEVLLVNDGSTDASGSICDSIAASDSRFHVFHKPNEGTAATRQYGIDHAQGDYTIHADSDDWVEPDYLECLYNKAISSGTDMVICDIMVEDGKRSVIKKQEPSAYDKDSLINDMLTRIQNGPCNKLVRRSFYMERNIGYEEGLDIGEDQLFNLKLAMAGATISYVPKALYHYDTGANPDSASRGSTLEKINKSEEFVLALQRLLPEGYQHAVDDKYLDIAYTAIKSGLFTASEYKEKFSFLSRVKWKNYYKKAFSIKLVVWTSVNVSYKLALFLYKVKLAFRKMR